MIGHVSASPWMAVAWMLLILVGFETYLQYQRQRPRPTMEELMTSDAFQRSYRAEVLRGQAFDAIMRAMNRRGMTRAEVAEKLGISEGKLCLILTGDATLAQLAHIAWALDTTFRLKLDP